MQRHARRELFDGNYVSDIAYGSYDGTRHGRSVLMVRLQKWMADFIVVLN